MLLLYEEPFHTSIRDSRKNPSITGVSSGELIIVLHIRILKT